MILNSPYISGSLTVTGNTTIQGQLTVTGSLSGTASLASNALLLQGTGSTGFATTSSLLEVSSSQQQISSSQQQISASLLNVIANYATTGSNSFRADQSITGSLVVSSTITAQTLVVQTVTSSIVYSSGSNNFGNQLANTQTFTGSVNITGSTNITGNINLVSSTGFPTVGLLNRSSDTTLYMVSPSNGFTLTDSSLNTIYNATPTVHNWNIGNALKMKLDASGSLGLGVTPSGWISTAKAFQLGNTAALYAPSSEAILSNNVFVDSTDNNKYITTNFASQYRQVNGQHIFYSADSGTAGNTVSFGSAKLTIAASGAATFSSNVSTTTGTTGATIKLGGFTNYGTIQDVNDVRRIWFENVGSYRTIFDLPTSGTSFAFRTNDGTSILSLTSAGAATFASSVTAAGVISSEDVRIYRSAGTTTGYINFGSTGTNYFGWAGSGFVFNGSINAGAATFSGKVIGNGFNSFSGDVSIASGVTSTIYTMGDNGLYTVQIIVGGGSLIYSAAAIFYAHSNNGQFVKTIDLYDGANVTLDQSSGAIRITNNGFATLTWNWSILHQRF